VNLELNDLFSVFGSNHLFISDPTLRFNSPQFAMLDCSTIDYVLISNHFNILGLPYLTQTHGFRGKVLATEPTIAVGRQLLQELVQFVEDNASEGWNTGNPLDDKSPWQHPSILSYEGQHLHRHIGFQAVK